MPLTDDNYDRAPHKKSRFNVIEHIGEQAVLFNTYTAGLAVLDKATLSCYQSGKFDDLPPTYQDAMLQNGFFVDAQTDELADYLAQYSAEQKTDVLSVTLFLATACNLDCVYCYQNSNSSSGRVIQPSALDCFLLWLDSELEKEDISTLEFTLYGGEPLLGAEHLTCIFKSVSTVASRHNVETQYSMITNGTLLTHDITDLLVACRCDLQISIDGPPEVHDQRRYDKKGKGTHALIMSNIQTIIERGGSDFLIVRINIDRGNIDVVEDTLLTLHNLGIKRIQCGRVHFMCGDTPYRSAYTAHEFASEVEPRIFGTLQECGYADVPTAFPLKTCCTLQRNRSFYISPELRVFKCIELLNRPNEHVGIIDDRGKLSLNEKIFQKQTTRVPRHFEKCMQCIYLPLCGSGCAIKASNTDGSLYQPYCEMNQSLLRLKLRTMLSCDSHHDKQQTQERG